MKSQGCWREEGGFAAEALAGAIFGACTSRAIADTVEGVVISWARQTPLEGWSFRGRVTSAPKRMWVLLNADHMRFCDRVERSHEFFRSMPQIGPMKEVAKNLPPMSELAPGEHGYLFANGLGTAQFDAVLKQNRAAQQLLTDGVPFALSACGIRAEPR